MLQVDENIGGRQDKKNNNSRQTKTLAGGLLLVLGCFAVGYFSVTTTTIATTAHTRVSSPNGNSFPIYNNKKYSQNSFQFFITHILTCVFFFSKHNR